jgi:hypothetical protein
MGYGNYSYEAHQAITRSRAAAPAAAVFQRNDCDPAMNPRGVRYRESRDSPDHPNSVGIVFALDVSGSMGEIPHQLATRTLPTFMAAVSTVLPDPQVLFMAFGNAHTDRSPLQVGQFESEAKLIDRWLSATHLEGAGGGLCESYEVAMYFVSRHTAMDCWEKRKKKGYFFMTGDEPPFLEVNKAHVAGLIGDHLEGTIYAHDIAREIQDRFHPFFLIPDQKRADTEHCGTIWKHLLHERCIVLETAEDTAAVCALCVGIQEGVLKDRDAITKQIEEKLGVSGAVRDRLLRAVVPFAEALARGPIAMPLPLKARLDVPNVKG